MTDVAQFVRRDVLQPLPAMIQLFVDLDGCLLHYGMSLFASADEEKVLPSRHPLRSILVVKSDAEHGGGLFPLVRGFHSKISRLVIKSSLSLRGDR